MLNTITTPAASNLTSSAPAARRVSPPPRYREPRARLASHAFATPVVRELGRRAPEPAAYARTW